MHFFNVNIILIIQQQNYTTIYQSNLTSMMSLTVHMLATLLLILFKGPLLQFFGWSRINKKTPKNIISFLFEDKTWDQILRFIQYSFTFIAGYISELPTSNYSSSQFDLYISKISHVNQLKKISTFFSITRKFIRVVRLKSQFESVSTSYYCTKISKSKIQITQTYMSILSDIFNICYYFTDHYSLLFSFGVLKNSHQEFLTDYYGNIFWVISNMFLIFKCLITFYRLLHNKKLQNKRERDFILISLVKNTIDTILALTYIYTQYYTSKIGGLMGLMVSVMTFIQFSK